MQRILEQYEVRRDELVQPWLHRAIEDDAQSPRAHRVDVSQLAQPHRVTADADVLEFDSSTGAGSS
jgi:hypothetical protein